MTDARLIIGDGVKTVSLQGQGPWLLGRTGDADVQFPDDDACSRRQARILRGTAGFVFEHLSEVSPSRLNGSPVTSPQRLHDGAVITFGMQRLVFSLPDAAELIRMGDVAVGVVGTHTVIGQSSDVITPGVPRQIPLQDRLSIGSQPMRGQVVFDHPAISRRHVEFRVAGGRVVVRDLRSTNGTFVNGIRLHRTQELQPGDRIDIGPIQLEFDGASLNSKSRVGNIELQALGLSFDVRAPSGDGSAQRILNNASLQLRPREFACIIGASGSGKSTLINILAGRAVPSEGSVSLNGVDLHANFQALKQDIAYVPQQDVLHELLTLRQALDYAARLRLPPDTSEAQRHTTVETAAESVELREQLDVRIGSLSGGQRKRASLASEILNRPSLLFLDEVTSGLDERTDFEIMHLLRKLADEGMTVVIVTHSLAAIQEFCHKIVCLGRGGHTAFFGSPSEALAFFDARRLGELFSRMDAGGPSHWRARFDQLAGGDAWRQSGPREAIRRVARHESWFQAMRRAFRQVWILTHRNTRLLLADRRTLGMAAVQSILIGGLLGWVFGDFGTGLERANSQGVLLLFLGLCAIWLGCNAASKDIVGELPIYRRERDINLSTAAFIAAKYVVSSAFTIVQLTVVFGLVALLAEGIPGDPLNQYLLLLLGALAGTAMGLVISAFANNRDQATTIVPLALVPQLVLSGMLIPKLPAVADALARVTVSVYWLTQAMKSEFIAADGPIKVLNAQTGQLMDMTAEPTGQAALIIAAHTAVLLLVTYVAMLLHFRSRTRGA